MPIIDNPIATHTLTTKTGEPVEILVAAPTPKGDDWVTRWSITGLTDKPITSPWKPAE
ncbi:MAG: hypothetical protein Q4A82_02375 [Corynebacterium sp.]|nr:hypothetical protein [Corynebacterium sp.]